MTTRRRSRAVDKAVARDFILLMIGSLGLFIQFVILPLSGRAWDEKQILLVGAEFIALGLPFRLPSGLFSESVADPPKSTDTEKQSPG